VKIEKLTCPACQGWVEKLMVGCETKGCGASYCSAGCLACHVCVVKLSAAQKVTEKLAGRMR
jgi:hypothetical protein